jgi:hypothetical protein
MAPRGLTSQSVPTGGAADRCPTESAPTSNSAQFVGLSRKAKLRGTEKGIRIACVPDRRALRRREFREPFITILRSGMVPNEDRNEEKRQPPAIETSASMVRSVGR